MPQFEFGGPIGASFVVISLPIVIYSLFFLCNGDHCLNTYPDMQFNFEMFQKSIPTKMVDLFNTPATLIYLGWIAFQILLERILPGEVVFGTELPNKQKLPYRLSGHLQFWISMIAMGHSIPIFSNGHGDQVIKLRGFMPLSLDLIYDNYLQLISISLLFCFALSIYIYLSSFYPSNKILAKGGNTGYAIYDFFIGRELNPRIGSLDIKEFCELRPGLIGWVVINLGMAVKQYKKNKIVDGFGSISLSMFCIVILQGYYVWDSLYNEKAILTTMDITSDGFGYMLIFGDLSWVPFIYSLQARYLVDYDPQLSLSQIGGVLLIHFIGFYIFRSANSEKDAFRRDPSAPEVCQLKYLETKRGTKLLISGWWGMARKINYTGDWLITLSWCMLCGHKSPIPYFQAVYFAILLIHRAHRDDLICHEKYGDDWITYKKLVPYQFIPYVF